MSGTADRFRSRKHPERNGIHGTTVVLSLVLHLVGFGAAVGLPRLMPRPKPGNQVYVVDLVALPPGKAAAPPAAAKKAPPRRKAPPKPKPAAPKPKPPKPKEEKPIKVPERTEAKPPAARQPEVERPKPVEPEPAPPEPQAAVDESAAAIDAAADTGGTAATGGVGVSVGGSGASGSGASDEYTFYLSLLDRNIRGAWNQPIYTGLEIKTATVSLELNRSGRILNLELLTPSGYDPLDRSVIRAVRDAAPFPHFPHFLGLDTLTVQIVFELDPGTLGAGSGE